MSAGATSTHLAARLLGPDEIQRGRSNTLSCPLYRAGAVVPATQSGSSITIFDGAGVAQVDAAGITVTNGIATYSYTPASSLPLGEGWQVVWKLIVEGVEHEFQNDAWLVRRALYPVVTEADLFRRVPKLNPTNPNPISTRVEHQDFLDEAWAEIRTKLIERGNRPNLILSPSALRSVHLYLALALIFESFATSLSADHKENAEKFRGLFEGAWGSMTFQYDSEQTGRPNGDGRRHSSKSTVWLGRS